MLLSSDVVISFVPDVAGRRNDDVTTCTFHPV